MRQIFFSDLKSFFTLLKEDKELLLSARERSAKIRTFVAFFQEVFYPFFEAFKDLYDTSSMDCYWT